MMTWREKERKKETERKIERKIQRDSKTSRLSKDVQQTSHVRKTQKLNPSL